MDSSQLITLGQDNVLEVTVKMHKTEIHKKKGPKCTSLTADSISGQKKKERSTTNNHKVWCNIFAKQSASYLKQVQSSKYHCKIKNDKKNINAENRQKNCNNHTNANPSKRISSQKKSEDHSKTLCCSSILVHDRAIQHPEICDNSEFAESNPIHKLDSLIKELKDLDLVRKDKKACEISDRMEQVLSKISANPKNVLSEDFKIKLKDGKAQMVDSGEKIKILWESRMLELEKLRSQVQKQDNYIKEIHQKKAAIEIDAKMLKEQLEEVTRTVEVRDKTLSILRQQIEDNELSEKEISDLKAELVKQTELVRKSHINNQYLTLERDKYLELCYYKDTLTKDYQNTIKDLQNQIAKQLEIMNEVHVKVRSVHTSTVHTPPASSSPTSSFSNRFTGSWHDLSNISSVKQNSREYITAKQDATIKDSTYLELVSLLDGESSHTVLDSCQNPVSNDKEATTQNNNNSTSRNLNTNDMIGKTSLFHSIEKDCNKENDVHKIRKFSRPKNIQNNTKKNSFHHDVSKILESIASNKIIVNVPSPVRDYPHPDWSDTSLPSISMTSNLDMVSSKNCTDCID